MPVTVFGRPAHLTVENATVATPPALPMAGADALRNNSAPESRPVLGPWERSDDLSVGVAKRWLDRDVWGAEADHDGKWKVWSSDGCYVLAHGTAADLPSAQRAADEAIRKGGWYRLAEDLCPSPEEAKREINLPCTTRGARWDGHQKDYRPDRPAPAWLDPAIVSKRVPRRVVAECAEAAQVIYEGCGWEGLDGATRSNWARSAAEIIDDCGVGRNNYVPRIVAAVLRRARELGYPVDAPIIPAGAMITTDAAGNVMANGRAIPGARLVGGCLTLPSPVGLTLERLRELRGRYKGDLGAALDECIARRGG